MLPGRIPKKRIRGTSSRQAQTLTAERQQELPSHFWAAELPSVAAVEKQQVSLFSELPVEGSLGKISIFEGEGTCQRGCFTAFLLIALLTGICTYTA